MFGLGYGLEYGLGLGLWYRLGLGYGGYGTLERRDSRAQGL